MEAEKKIIILDTTLRDGEQCPGASMTVQEKFEVAKQLAKLGVDVLEAGFPIASQGEFEAVSLIAQNIKGPVICAGARANKSDIDRAWDAIKHAEKSRISLFVATSYLHMEKKLRKTKDQIMEIIKENIPYAKSLCNDIEFTLEDCSRTDLDYMCDVIRTAIECGANTINIADTVGYAQPDEFGHRIKYLLEHVKEANDVMISVHCHNDLGLAVANSLSAIKNGATQIECTINGIGERAGNCSLEEIVMNLKTRRDYFGGMYTDINTKEIYATSQLVTKITGFEVQKNKAIVGQNAFSHASGIHQHGVLANAATYEIMNPEEVGWKGEKIVISKHSGKHGVEAVLKKNGYQLDKEQIEVMMVKVKEVADNRKTLENKDIIAIVMEVMKTTSKNESHLVSSSIS